VRTPDAWTAAPTRAAVAGCSAAWSQIVKLGSAPTTEITLLRSSDPRVQLVGLQHQGDDPVLVRLRSNSVSGLTSTLRLPPGVVCVARSTFLGERPSELAVQDGRVAVTFEGSGVRSLLLTLGDLESC